MIAWVQEREWPFVFLHGHGGSRGYGEFANRLVFRSLWDFGGDMMGCSRHPPKAQERASGWGQSGSQQHTEND